MDGGNSLISAMMLFVGNEEKVYILDKAEMNAAVINGHPAWGAVWDINSHKTTVMDVPSNVFCASGMHLPNGSYVTFGGNNAVAPGGGLGSQVYPGGGSASWDSTLQDFDGSRSIRILNPCTSTDNFASSNCQWFDDSTLLAMQKQRWYSAAEPLGDGTVVIIGGFVLGGYVNRMYPNTDPQFEQGQAESTFEFFPAKSGTPQVMQFLIKTSGLNAYAHTFLMPSGKMFLQANTSSMLWDANANVETALPDMPNNVVRVYPASGAVAMLPLTPANNYVPTILFCGGQDMPSYSYGDYRFPYVETWNQPASRDCQRITPEPADGSAPVYVQDDNMIDGRTMGQFIILPDGKLLVVNGGLNGTAGYATSTLVNPDMSTMPWGMSLASGPVLTPAIYDPNAPAGSRWSNAGLQSSTIPRLYHSSAMLLPDASVMIAGSNPNSDVNLTAIFPTTYKIEIFYPPYFNATNRPVPSGVPKTISYGGSSFDITIPSTSYTGSSNDAADATKVVLIRGGFTTHAMNMGQRYLQLNNTYTVNSNGALTLHVAQAPPNPNIFQPGPAFLYVVMNGIPSNGTYVILGNGQIGTQPTSAASTLPDSIRLATATGGVQASATSSATSTGNGNGTASHSSTPSTGTIVGGVVGGIAIIGILGAIVAVILSRRRRAATPPSSTAYADMAMSTPKAGVLASDDASASLPLHQTDYNHAWNSSSVDFSAPYRDEAAWRGSSAGVSMDSYDPYTRPPMTHAMSDAGPMGRHSYQQSFSSMPETPPAGAAPPAAYGGGGI